MKPTLAIALTALTAASLAACTQKNRAYDPTTGLLSAGNIDPATPRAYVNYFPGRLDDIAWENDRTAFRIYGPELETAAPPISSGIDAWSKKVRTPVIDKWYDKGEHFYHYDQGEGMDGFKTGPSRGCGGIGVWDTAAQKLYNSRDWASFQILSRGPQEASFHVTYAPWRITTPTDKVANAGAPGRKVWQSSIISLPMGSNLNRITTVLYSNEPGDLIVAVGLATHGAPDGVMWHSDFKSDLPRMTYWDKTDSAADDKNDNGFQGTGLIVNPAQFVGIAHIDTDNLLLIKVTPGTPFTYYAGNCWSNGLDFHNNQQWNTYIQSFKPTF